MVASTFSSFPEEKLLGGTHTISGTLTDIPAKFRFDLLQLAANSLRHRAIPAEWVPLRSAVTNVLVR